MRKRILCAMLALLMIVTLLPVVVGAASDPTITFVQQATAAGASEVKVDVKITNNPGFVSATIPVKWDASIMTLTNVTEVTDVVDSGWCSMSMTEYATNGTQGTYYLAWNNDTRTEADGGNFTNDGTLATLTFALVDKTVDTNTQITSELTADIANMMNFAMADLRNSGLTAVAGMVNVTAADAGGDTPVEEDGPTLNIAQIEALVGSTIEIGIYATNNPGFSGMQLDLTIPEQFNITGVNAGALVAGATFTPSAIGTDGYYPNNLSIAIGGSAVLSGDGCVAVLTLEVPEGVPVDDYTLGLSLKSCYDGNYAKVTFKTVAGKISVFDYVKGDASGDGVVDILDVVVLSRYLAGGYTLPGTFNIKACNISKEAGIDAEDEVDILDVVILSRYLAGGYNISFD